MTQNAQNGVGCPEFSFPRWVLHALARRQRKTEFWTPDPSRLRIRSSAPLVFFGLALALLAADVLHAQPVPSRDPSSTHIFPAGGRRGTAVAVRVGAEAIPPGASLYVFSEGVSASERLGERLPSRGEPSLRRKPTEIPISRPREWQAQIEIAADAPLGPVAWRLGGAQGGTGTRPFVIGDLPEFIETESNSTFETAERISLPVTVNGQIDGERDLDFFRFTAEESDVVVCEVQARRLGSRLDPVVAILTPDGRSVSVETVHVGDDPVVAFHVPRSGEYVLCISNVTFHGDPAHVYRVNVSTAPFICAAFPAGWQAGEECEVEFYALSGTGALRVERDTIRFSAPSEAVQRLEIDERPNVLEREPNDSPADAQPISLPLTVNGRFQSDRDTDWFRFTASAGETLSIACRGYPAGGAARPGVALFDAAGTQLAQARSIECPDGVCRIEWTAPQSGEYRLRLRDLQHGVRGGLDFVYRLTVEPARPEFELSVAADAFDVLQEGRSQLPVKLRRSGGFTGPVELRLEGLPAGVQAEPARFPEGGSDATLTVSATADAIADSTPLRLIGQAGIEGQTVERVARCRQLGHDSEGVALAEPTTERLNLTVRHKPLFRLFCLETYQYAHRGTVFPYPMQIERLDGFDGPVTLQIADRQNRDLDGIEMFEVTIPPGESSVRLPIHLPETMHINIQSQSQLYCQGHASFVDRHGRPQSVLVVSEKRNMIRTLPAVVKLKALDDEIVLDELPAESQGRAGPREVRCRLRVDRTTNFPGPLDVELLDPPAESGVAMLPLTIAAGQIEAEAVLRLDERRRAGDRLTVRFRGTGRMADGTQVISECAVAFR
ncbi:MAG TPA: PPC domain-containing protein [Planctomycetaceae bacterium]|nr:PPC domain-containing protein [Planctomycetaceae bacterium]